ncbi:CBS domain-containing protein [Actinoplanes sp. NPDC023714]|uniref:CBS domain-containing protein n=1 Tax=Actinoplanes sp. NPDC023714 TaxID=3154322 RepID=UPI0033EC3A55
MKIWHVDDVMTTEVVTAAPAATYRQLVDLIIERRVGAVPVIDDFRRVTGVVSEADLLRKIEYAEDDQPRLFEGRRRRDQRGKAAAGTAAELMSTPAVTALRGTSIPSAARIMEREQVKHLPVTDDLGRLVGIVSRADLLRVHLRADDDIRTDVDSGVLQALSIAGSVKARVVDGVLTLTGRVDRRSTAERAVAAARQIPGVAAVTDRVAFDYDDNWLEGAVSPLGIA